MLKFFPIFAKENFKQYEKIIFNTIIIYPEIVFGKDKRKFRRKVERKLKGKKKYGFK